MFQTFPRLARFVVFVLVPDLQLSNTRRPGRDASFTKGGDLSPDVLAVRSSVLLDNHTACPGVPFYRRTQQFLNQYCACAPGQVLLCVTGIVSSSELMMLLLDWVGVWMWV